MSLQVSHSSHNPVRHRESRSPSDRGNARTTGLIVAVCVGLVFVAVIGWFVTKHRTRASGGASLDPGTGPTPNPLGQKISPSGGGVVSGLAEGKEFFLQLTDENDPTRLQGELTAQSSQPLAQKRYKLERPRAWWFMRDGRSLFLEADHGVAYIPGDGKSNRPQDGALSGNVVIRLFAKTNSNTRPNPDTDRPLLTVRTTQLSFDGTLGQLDLPDAVLAESDALRFSGAGLRALLNEPEQRVEQLTIERTDWAFVYPGKSLGGNSAAPAPRTSAAPSSSQPAPATQAAQPAELSTQTLYHVTASGSPVIVQGTRRISGETLDAFVRLVDNALRDTAIANSAERQSAPISTPTHNQSLTSTILTLIPAAITQILDDQASPAPLRSDANEEPVLLRWRGPLIARVVPAAPDLTRNDVLVRMSAQKSGGVLFSDTQAGVDGRAEQVTYGATLRHVSLQDRENVVLGGSNLGVAAAPRFDIFLNDGRVEVPGGGILTANPESLNTLGNNSTSVARVQWDQEATFEFETLNGQMTGNLLNARILGRSFAGSADGGIRAESLVVSFLPSRSSPSPRLLTAIGEAAAWSAESGRIDGETIQVSFFTNQGDKPLPSRMLARGGARATRGEDTLAAETINATLAVRRPDEAEVVQVLADGDVRYTGPNALSANADAMIADPIMQTVQLVGENAAIRRAGSCIAGPVLNLDGLDRRMIVPAAGSFEHQESGGDAVASVIRASWGDRMVFDDLAGIVRCEGHTAMEWSRAGISLDTVRASTVEILLADSVQPQPTTARPTNLASSRTINRAVAIGSASPATIESRRFAANETPLRLEQLLYLEGARIEMDNVAGTLFVPGAGRLLTADRRSLPSREASRNEQLTSLSSRGTSLFTWTGSLTMNRSSGIIMLNDTVRLVQDDPMGQRTELECRTLEATIRERTNAASNSIPEPSFAGELISVRATDTVWMRSGTREITADSLGYDALARKVNASALPGRKVTVVDPGKAAPLSASGITWDLHSGRIEATEISPVVTPR